MSLLLLVLFLVLQHVCVDGFAAYMLQNECSTRIGVGETIMDTSAVLSPTFFLSVNEAGGADVAYVVPGRVYSVSVSNPKTQWALEIAGGAFSRGGCSGKTRIYQGQDTTFTVSSSSNDDASITLVGTTASRYGTVSVSPLLTLPIQPQEVSAFTDDAQEVSAFTDDAQEVSAFTDDAQEVSAFTDDAQEVSASMASPSATPQQMVNLRRVTATPTQSYDDDDDDCECD